jgi:glycosyltransferase involved in cell wall biosynthesis
MESAAKHVDAFIAPSRFSEDIHRVKLNIPIVHLPNFVPASAEDVSSPTDRKSQQEPYFLFVGRLEILKGLQTLIPIFRRYRKAQLWIAGTGEHEPRLQQLAEGSTNIRFLGYRSAQELNALYRQAVAAIVPSLYYENFPLVTIEAFRQQTPVIVRNLGGLPEIVRESTGGFVYNSDEELEAAMDQLLANPSSRREMGLRGYKAYKQNWTAEAHLQGYFRLIREIASTRGQPQGVKRESL